MPGRVMPSRHFYLDQFGSGESDMFGGDLLAFFIGSGDQSAAGRGGWLFVRAQPSPAGWQ